MNEKKWLVNIGSAVELVPPGNKSQPETILTQIYDISMASLGHNELIHLRRKYQSCTGSGIGWHILVSIIVID